MFFALRCCAAELSAPASPCVLCSTPLLLACFMAAALTLLRSYALSCLLLCSLSLAVMRCSSRCVVDLSGSRAPCMPLRAGGALPCPVAGGGWGVGVVVAQGA